MNDWFLVNAEPGPEKSSKHQSKQYPICPDSHIKRIIILNVKSRARGHEIYLKVHLFPNDFKQPDLISQVKNG